MNICQSERGENFVYPLTQGLLRAAFVLENPNLGQDWNPKIPISYLISKIPISNRLTSQNLNFSPGVPKSQIGFLGPLIVKWSSHYLLAHLA